MVRLISCSDSQNDGCAGSAMSRKVNFLISQYTAATVEDVYAAVKGVQRYLHMRQIPCTILEDWCRCVFLVAQSLSDVDPAEGETSEGEDGESEEGSFAAAPAPEHVAALWLGPGFAAAQDAAAKDHSIRKTRRHKFFKHVLHSSRWRYLPGFLKYFVSTESPEDATSVVYGNPKLRFSPLTFVCGSSSGSVVAGRCHNPRRR
jgi:hypothetical protein